MIYLLDLDGTVVDIEHRLHFLRQQTPDWTSFYAAADGDTPIWEVITVVRALKAAGHIIIVSTGRSEDIRLLTAGYLSKYRIPFDTIYMRGSKDHREDNVVKSEILDEIIAKFPKEKIGGAFEDRQQVVDMYRARGIKVFQVAKGNF